MTFFAENDHGKDERKLMAETPAYTPRRRTMEGTITGEVTTDGLKNIRIAPLPGGNKTPSVPDWHLKDLNEPHLVQRMLEAGKLIK